MTFISIDRLHVLSQFFTAQRCITFINRKIKVLDSNKQTNKIYALKSMDSGYPWNLVMNERKCKKGILFFDMGVGHARMFIFNHTLIICIFYVCILYFKNILK